MGFRQLHNPLPPAPTITKNFSSIKLLTSLKHGRIEPTNAQRKLLLQEHLHFITPQPPLRRLAGSPKANMFYADRVKPNRIERIQCLKTQATGMKNTPKDGFTSTKRQKCSDNQPKEHASPFSSHHHS
jgi:hypothetical protein